MQLKLDLSFSNELFYPKIKILMPLMMLLLLLAGGLHKIDSHSFLVICQFFQPSVEKTWNLMVGKISSCCAQHAQQIFPKSLYTVISNYEENMKIYSYDSLSVSYTDVADSDTTLYRCSIIIKE